MRKLGYTIAGFLLLTLFAYLGYRASPSVWDYYPINADTIRIKSTVAPTVGNVLVAIDTFGDYVTGTTAAIPIFGIPIKDSIATTGATVNLAVNTSYVVTASSSISC